MPDVADAAVVVVVAAIDVTHTLSNDWNSNYCFGRQQLCNPVTTNIVEPCIKENDGKKKNAPALPVTNITCCGKGCSK